MNKVKKNFIIYSLSQVILLALPLIVFPYVSKVLGVYNLGLYDYLYTITTYFLIFAKLGIMNYGAREIAEKNNKEETFKRIYTIQFLLTSIIIIIYILFCLIINKKTLLNYIYVIFIIANYFDIAWFFQGVQDFQSITIRNLIINIIEFFGIFILVHTEKDLNIYVIIMSLSQVVGNFLVWLKLKKYISLKNVFSKKTINLKETLIGMAILFIPILANNIYILMDETMLGQISVIGEVGLYACAKKIMYIPLAFITPLSMVMLPYMSEVKSKKRKVNSNEIEQGLIFTIWLSIACFVGLSYIAQDVINIFFGEEYEGAILIIRTMAFYSLFFTINVYLRDVLFLPDHKDKMFVITVITGIPINLIFNILFIPKMGAFGATLASVISELIVLIIRICLIIKKIKWNKILKETLIYLFCSCIMCGITSLMNIKIYPFFKLFLEVLICAFIYILLTGSRIKGIIGTKNKSDY